MAIPKILGDPRYEAYRMELNKRTGERSTFISNTLQEIPELTFNPTYGAFYNTIVFKEGTLTHQQTLPIKNERVKSLVEKWVEGVSLDFRFVYYLLGATGICVVPISSFCSDLRGFRITLLEENEQLLKQTFTTLRDSIRTYLDS